MNDQIIGTNIHRNNPAVKTALNNFIQFKHIDLQKTFDDIC
jgi:hypothetical protein